MTSSHHAGELQERAHLVVKEAAEHEVVGALLAVLAQAEERAVAALTEELQRGFAASLKGPHFVWPRITNRLELLELVDVQQHVLHHLAHLGPLQDEDVLGILFLHE